MNTPTRKSGGPTLARFTVDLILFVGLVLVALPRATGVGGHEWGSVAFIVIVLVHVLLGWRWFVAVSRRVFGKLGGQMRLNYVWDLVLYLTMTTSFVSGIAVSEVALPVLGLEPSSAAAWGPLHDMSSNILTVMLGIHLALHEVWVVDTWRRWRSGAKGVAALLPELRRVLWWSVVVIGVALIVTWGLVLLVDGPLTQLQGEDHSSDAGWLALTAMSTGKLAMLMGVPALLTLGVRRLIARFAGTSRRRVPTRTAVTRRRGGPKRGA